MNCGRLQSRIALYVEGDLTGQQLAQVESHLAECQDCRILADELAESQAALHGLRAERVSEEAYRDVRARVMANLPAPEPAWLGLFHVAGWRFGVLTLAVFAILGTSLWWLTQGPESRSQARKSGAPHNGASVPSLSDLGQQARMPLSSQRGNEFQRPERHRARRGESRRGSEMVPERAEPLSTGTTAAALSPSIAERPPGPVGTPAAVPVPVATTDDRAAPGNAGQTVSAATETKPRSENQQILVKILTDDPQVVIYWLASNNGG